MLHSPRVARDRALRLVSACLFLTLLLAGRYAPGALASPAGTGGAGALDPTFGGYGEGGRVLNDWPAAGSIRDAVRLPDGALIVVGSDGQDFLIARYDAAGQLDPAFGDAGSARVGFLGASSVANAVAIDPDGNLLVAGSAGSGALGNFAVARLHADGTPDASFGVGGHVAFDFNGRRDAVFAVLPRFDGTILLAGGVEESGQSCLPSCNSNLGFARLNSNGSLDAGFGTGGLAQTDLGGSEVALAAHNSQTGRFFAVGSRFGVPSRYLIAQYNASGTLATGFGGTGVVSGTALSRLVAVDLAPDGTLLALGDQQPNIESDIGVMRFNANGSPVGDFGTSDPGLQMIDVVGGIDTAGALHRLPDGSIVVAGSGDQSLMLARLTDEGAIMPGSVALTEMADVGASDVEALSVSLAPDVRLWTASRVQVGAAPYLALTRHFLDGSADDGGRQATDYDPSGAGAGSSNDDRGMAVAFQPDGKLLVAGGTSNGSTTAALLTRYTTDGALDPEFGGGGLLTVDPILGAAVDLAVQANGRILVAGPDFDVARLQSTGIHDVTFNGGYTNADWDDSESAALALQSDGKPVLAGSHANANGTAAFALARFTANGVLEDDFGNGGLVVTGIGLSSVARDVTTQPDGKLIVAGGATDSLSDPVAVDFALARYNPDGSLDMSFGEDGRVTTDFGSADQAQAVLMQPDGKIVAAGASANQGMAFARYLPNGAPDNSFSGDGRQLLQILGGDVVRGLALDGGALVAAVCDDTAGAGLVVRLTPAGALDNSFNGNGRAPFSFASVQCPLAVAVANGRIAAAGYAQNPTPPPLTTYMTEDFAVAVYLSGIQRLFLPLLQR